ncbi:MAG: enoyl-CoA hydratase/isomerase family protein [Gammaproteobacteria bacterium]|jgi:enoyl-CoA hydratase/carnithine racemase|nr:enoyl-CoA hydratase/isomerase family protein [Gammaproteobacteria bacterium]MDG2435375.1 enoyl-CoA hydratase/isomerase family protein [Gammaproteobacteria bacterium]
MENPNLFKFDATVVSIDGYVMTITLDRPEKKNAINEIMANEIIYALKYATKNNQIRVVIIQANGDTFCSGGDLKGMSGKQQQSSSTVPKLGDIEDVSLLLRNLNKPVIVKIQGNVFAGALMIVANATHAISSVRAKFAAPEIKRGIWPFMVMAGLFRVMPKRQGLDFIMRGNAIDAQTAKKYGLINECLPQEELDEFVNSLSDELSNLPPNTMRMGLQAYNQQDLMEFNDALPYLRQQLKECIENDDAKEGIAAFFEKREPKWKEEIDES